MGYTLGQFRAYQSAAAKLENERAAMALQVTFMGAQGSGKGVEKMIKALGG